MPLNLQKNLAVKPALAFALAQYSLTGPHYESKGSVANIIKAFSSLTSHFISYHSLNLLQFTHYTATMRHTHIYKAPTHLDKGKGKAEEEDNDNDDEDDDYDDIPFCFPPPRPREKITWPDIQYLRGEDERLQAMRDRIPLTSEFLKPLLEELELARQ